MVFRTVWVTFKSIFTYFTPNYRSVFAQWKRIDWCLQDFDFPVGLVTEPPILEKTLSIYKVDIFSVLL